jgi:4-hydroxybenzoyl-CoA thioesterase
VARYTASVPVRFAEIDRAGIVYYPRFFHYFHIAFEEFFAGRVGVPYNVLLDRDRVGFPTVRAECDYRSPIRFGDVLRVEVSVERLGRTSVVFLYRLRRSPRAPVSAEARVTVVCVDMDAFRPIPIPPRCRRAFERHREPAPPRSRPRR